MKILLNLFISLGFLLSLQTLSSQGNFVLSGRISDATTGEYLPGAAVAISGSAKGAVSDLDGEFIISGIQQEEVEVIFSYISYKSQTLKINFAGKKRVNLLVKLEQDTKYMDEVIVTGQTEGKVKAMLEQRIAANIKNVISSEQIKEFPDMNAAEAMQRIPGITLQRDQGEGRFVQLRGTPPEYTNFSINGEQIPSPEGGVRYVGLDVIAADQIEFIEVTKVLTPDMDADGIAGNVNIITKMPKSGEPEVLASLAGGYNDLMKTNNYQAQFSFGERVNNFGFQMNANYYKNDQGSHNMEFDYTRGPTTQQSQGTDSLSENYQILYSDIELRHYTITRERIGLSANIDYQPNEKLLFYVRGMYNRFSDDEQRRRITYDFSDANTPLVYREAGIDRDIRDRIEYQTISTINVGGEFEFNNGIKLDYEGSISTAIEDIPDYMFASFDNGGITMAVNIDDPQWPTLSYPSAIDSIDAFTYENYEFDKLRFNSSLVKDINRSAKINLEIPYRFSANSSGSVKLGGKLRLKDKTRERQNKSYSKYYETLNLYSQIGPPLNVTTVEDEFNETNLINQGYVMDHMPNHHMVRDFFEKHPQNFKYDEIKTWGETYGEDYISSENIYAAFIMFHHDINRLMILGGLRIEKTDINYQAAKAGIEYVGNGLLFIDTIDDSRSHNFILPQLQFKYRLTDKTNFRAAITYTYSRPNFDDVLPYRRENDNGDVDFGNPDLKYPLSMNLDLLAETYLKNSGVISGGIFYKKIQNPIFSYVGYAHQGDNFNRFGLQKISMAVNGIEADVYGAEIQTQFKFSKLPGFLSDFGIYGNYTFTESEALISYRSPKNDNTNIFIFNEDKADFFTNSDKTESIPLEGQARHTINLALFYDAKKFYGKISAHNHSDFLSELSSDSELDYYNQRSLHIDFTANYQVNESLNFFIDLINITNEPLRFYMGSTDYFKQQEYYSWWGRVGVKVEF